MNLLQRPNTLRISDQPWEMRNVLYNKSLIPKLKKKKHNNHPNTNQNNQQNN